MLLACRGSNEKPKEESPAAESQQEVEARLQDAGEPSGALAQRCALLPDQKPVVVRSQRPARDEEDLVEEQVSEIELGQAIAWGDGFAVGLLRTGARSQAQVLVLDGQGTSRVIDLATVHGQVDPPQVAAAGAHLLAVFQDSEASGKRLRSVKILHPLTEARLVLGPEVSEGRDESSVFSLRVARGSEALLLWDREDRSSARSQIFRLPFSVETMQAGGAEERVALGAQDEEAPFLVERPGGYWLLGMSYESLSSERGAGQAEGRGVLEEPPARLWVLPVSERGKAEGAALPLFSDAFHVHALDALQETEDSLLIAVRRSSHSSASSELVLFRVGVDGSKKQETVEAQDWGLGAPVFLRDTQSKQVWLGVHQLAGGMWLGAVAPSGHTTRLEAERELRSREVLVSGEKSWLVVEPRGADLAFQFLSCKQLP